MIKILKASAGSGKTYNLAKTYISLLLRSEDRFAYRHILAVTFTNKATAEMKSRILKELSILADDPTKSDYYNDFVPSLSPDASSLQRRTKQLLVDILHDYTAFNISTIDKFFQQTLKAFSREIGQFSSYQVELDRNSLSKESVDRILDSLTEDQTALMEWLNAGVMKQLNDGNRVNIETPLYSMAQKLKSEEQREMSEKYNLDFSTIFSNEALSEMEKECEAAINHCESMVKTLAGNVISFMEEAGVALEDTYKKYLVPICKYVDFPIGTLVRPTDAFLRRARDEQGWFAKGNAKTLLPAVSGLDIHLNAFCDFFDKEFKAYKTALIVKSQLFSLGLANSFYQEFNNILKEKNVISIDDSNSILRSIIDGSDAPFIYEKLGVRYEHFLLDEFQDTSTIQWQNFHPLLSESDSNDHDNLVVGDVKQSIYRWRNSDWNLLDNILPSQFPSSNISDLRTNYRSTENVVEFNNRFFEFASKVGGIEKIYSDVKQAVHSDDTQKGCVSVSFCDKDRIEDEIIYAVNQALQMHAEYGDIAILVRNNEEGGSIASLLISNGFPVISDDSLSLKSSVIVRRLVSLLSCIENRNDRINAYLAGELNIAFPEHYHSLVDLCEGLLRSLKENDADLFNGEILYIQSFMDNLQEWSIVNGNNLMLFLKYWSDAEVKLSSPAAQNAIRIMTIHKSKGLEFAHVIFPYAEKVKIHDTPCHWCKPQKDDLLPSVCSRIFPVQIDDTTKHTLFSDKYDEEYSMQFVDAINIFYVALTRPRKGIHIISQNPSQEFMKTLKSFSLEAPESMMAEAKDFSQLLYAFMLTSNIAETEGCDEENEAEVLRYRYGELYDYSQMKRKVNQKDNVLQSDYATIALNDRLKLSTDALDFFSEDGSAGISASHRLRGIILHDILSRVNCVDELVASVSASVNNGDLSALEGREVLALLKERLSLSDASEWFSPENQVLNEMSIIAKDGSVHRPDRIVVKGDRTIVIDYKFGEMHDSYIWQVRKYMKLLREMGFKNVSGYLWFVAEDVITSC